MIRFFWLGFRLLLFMLAAVWLSDHPGKVVITWQGYLIETSVGALIVIVVVALGALYLLGRLLRDLIRIPQRWARHKELQQGRRGRKALTSGLAAVASGDAATARRMARQTEATIVDPVLSHLLTAEALILSGENDAAEGQFELLLGREDTRVIGHRGLIEVTLARGDWARAYTRARQARGIMPKSPWLLTLLIDLAARAGDLGEAKSALDEAMRSRILTGQEAKRRLCTLLTAMARQAERNGQTKDALAHADKALDENPGFIPAAILAARLNLLNERRKSAERILERAWDLEPHPDLIDAWRRLAPADDPQSALRWMKRLKEAHPDNPDAALAYAAAAIESRQWNEARAELESLAASAPAAAESYLLLGRLEREQTGNTAAAATWYEKAALAPSCEPRWICHACGHHLPSWNEICPDCGAFAQIQTPKAERQEKASPPKGPTSLPGIGTPLAKSL